MPTFDNNPNVDVYDSKEMDKFQKSAATFNESDEKIEIPKSCDNGGRCISLLVEKIPELERNLRSFKGREDTKTVSIIEGMMEKANEILSDYFKRNGVQEKFHDNAKQLFLTMRKSVLDMGISSYNYKEGSQDAVAEAIISPDDYDTDNNNFSNQNISDIGFIISQLQNSTNMSSKQDLSGVIGSKAFKRITDKHPADEIDFVVDSFRKIKNNISKESRNFEKTGTNSKFDLDEKTKILRKTHAEVTFQKAMKLFDDSAINAVINDGV